MTTFGHIFRFGLSATQSQWLGRPEDPDLLWPGLAFIDAAKCVAIREGLRRHSGVSREASIEPWRPTANVAVFQKQK
jgi:hypothetical protein